MNEYKYLSGEDLVAKGATKSETKLPEIGLKDVIPTGSWLEQKQIQSALETRKHLIEVERIDKRGCLSDAVWDDRLKLAQVTQQVGGHWRYLGHNRDKKLYLRPEEALYLMEVNCLLLRYNGIIVSLQQAYALLLPDDISFIQYQVYSSLSRVGYKVFRHKSLTSTSENSSPSKNISKPPDESKKNSTDDAELVLNSKVYEESIKENETINVSLGESEIIMTCEASENEKSISDADQDQVKSLKDDDNLQTHLKNSNLMDNAVTKEVNPSMDQGQVTVKNDKSSFSETLDTESKTCDTNPMTQFYEWKSKKLKIRQDKPKCSINALKSFENVPDFSNNQVVTIHVPKEEHIPKNIYLNNLTYVINVQNVQSRNVRSSDSTTYSMSDEVNGDHIRRVTSSNNRPQNTGVPPFYQTVRPPRNFNFWRPRHQMNYYQFNLFFQRAFMPNFLPRYQYFPRASFPRYYFNNHQTFNPSNVYANPSNRGYIEQTRKRTRDSARKFHLDSIKNLAVRLRQLISSGNIQTQNVEALQRLINTYNTRYRSKVRLTDEFDVVDETVIETIDLEDEEETETKPKKRRVKSSTSDTYEEHVNKIKLMALKLKQLDSEKKSSTSHRRAISGLIKVFNKSFNAGIYMNDNFEILDRMRIVLDSSSESDCVVEDVPKETDGKMLINPFSILKSLTGKLNSASSSTCTQNEPMNDEPHSFHIACRDSMEEIFGKNWLPSTDDFGRPEITARNFMNPRIIEAKKEEYLFEFLKNKPTRFKNWVEVKLAFQDHVEDTNDIIQTNAMMEEIVDLKSLVQPEDCKDVGSILKKLSIIKSKKDLCHECSLSITFDVYNRDVPNFRKTDPPKPHFRIVCLKDTSPFPSGVEIASLHSKYDDNITIVFAIVGVGNVAYLQINPSDLPLYTPSNDFG